jgi:REG-2-like HAD superfamily hydrolase
LKIKIKIIISSNHHKPWEIFTSAELMFVNFFAYQYKFLCINMLARNLQRFKVITFDCTNTLLYFKIPPSEMYLKTALEMGEKQENFNENCDMMKSFRSNFKELNKSHPIFGKDSIGYNEWWTRLVTRVLKEASTNIINEDSCNKIAQKLIRKYETDECWAKFKKSEELLKAIKDQNKILGVISNFDPRLYNLLNNMKLANYFDFVITSYEVGIEKPNAEIFYHALEEAKKINANIKPNEVLHIGNERDKDIIGANNANFSAVLIDPEGGHFRDIEQFYNLLNSETLNL